MPTSRAFISSQITFHDFLTHILRLKSYLYPLRHFGLPLDQNGFNVCGDFAPREGLSVALASSRFEPPMEVSATALLGDFSISEYNSRKAIIPNDGNGEK
ncbi:MAG: deoxyribodipyrimidine photolyase-related protein [Circular genetic element sp.]|nr:MAG: deoxyribodipyrimidine photolyase-related protein [Circular genetic element sp.]